MKSDMHPEPIRSAVIEPSANTELTSHSTTTSDASRDLERGASRESPRDLVRLPPVRDARPALGRRRRPDREARARIRAQVAAVSAREHPAVLPGCSRTVHRVPNRPPSGRTFWTATAEDGRDTRPPTVRSPFAGIHSRQRIVAAPSPSARSRRAYLLDRLMQSDVHTPEAPRRSWSDPQPESPKMYAPLQTPYAEKIERLGDGERPRVLDLFAGCGGLSLGLQAAGLEVTAAVENDADAARSHGTNFHKAAPEHVLARDVLTSPDAFAQAGCGGTGLHRPSRESATASPTGGSATPNRTGRSAFERPRHSRPSQTTTSSTVSGVT